MPQYKVLAKSYINGSIVEEGAIVEYDGRPGSNLELIEEGKPQAKPKGKRGVFAADAPEDQSGE